MTEQAKPQWGRNLFVFVTIAFCLVTAALMGFDQSLTTKVSEIVADGLISLSLFVAVSFLASYSVDYSGVLSKVGNRLGGRVVTTPPIETPPQYESTDPETAPSEAKG